jgi:para-nitrobenzyl esterase
VHGPDRRKKRRRRNTVEMTPKAPLKENEMSTTAKPIVGTRSGKVEGLYANGQYEFRGIPYAAAPVGVRRWLPPQPVTPWEGIRSAKEFGSISPQNQMPGSDALPGLSITDRQDEDCLFLNIATPGLEDARRPVMVWIHGGAFIIGAGSQVMYQNSTLVPRGNVVLVTINYRLGAFGFMNLKEITGGKIPATGCEGLLDQIAAIEWVRDNIGGFGGDPDNITIFGESAGGMSIGCLMGMPAARGKFQKAILESGAANTVSSLEDSVDAAGQFLDILKLKAGDIDGIRSLSAQQIMSAQQLLGDIMREREYRMTPFQPVVDGTVLPEIPIVAINKGSASGVKTLIGTNLDEFQLFNLMDPGLRRIDEAGMARRLENFIPSEYVSRVVAAYRKAREKRGEKTAPADLLTAIQSDLMFRISALRLAEAQCRNDQPAYNYLFTWKSPVMSGILGSCHALEIGFVFGNYDDTFCGSGPDADALSRKIQDAWASFARTGSPSCKSLGPWNPYGDRRTTMILDKECRIENAPYEEERAVWDTFKMLFTKPI